MILRSPTKTEITLTLTLSPFDKSSGQAPEWAREFSIQKRWTG